jgi:hypothetical protein
LPVGKSGEVREIQCAHQDGYCIPKEGKMKDVQSYCDNVVAELTVWKAKIYDVVRRIDKLSSGDKSKFADQVNDLHMYIQEIENRMARLRTECPMDWKTDQIEMDSKFDHLKGKMNDLHANFSPGDIGG